MPSKPQNKLQIKIGIGIASGRVIVSYAGTQHRHLYLRR
jgi:hypothetical protein